MLFLKLLSAWFSEFLLFCGYVCGNNTFPPPLSQKDEIKYLEKLESGDSTARKILIERNMRLVVHIAKKYSDDNSLSDFISIGTIGLIKGIDTYNFQTKKRLSPYVSRCIENEILMFLRKNNNQRNEISLDEPLNVDWDGNELLLSDILGTDVDSVYKDLEYDVEKELLRLALSKLSSREKQIMELRFGLDNKTELTQKEVADLLGISQSYISRLEKKIISRLKKEIEKVT